MHLALEIAAGTSLHCLHLALEEWCSGQGSKTCSLLLLLCMPATAAEAPYTLETATHAERTRHVWAWIMYFCAALHSYLMAECQACKPKSVSLTEQPHCSCCSTTTQ
jgi:hypothetical protein